MAPAWFGRGAGNGDVSALCTLLESGLLQGGIFVDFEDPAALLTWQKRQMDLTWCPAGDGRLGRCGMSPHCPECPCWQEEAL